MHAGLPGPGDALDPDVVRSDARIDLGPCPVLLDVPETGGRHQVDLEVNTDGLALVAPGRETVDFYRWKRPMELPSS